MTPTTYAPEPGSPAARVLGLLQRNPEDNYTGADLALKFQVKAGAWAPLLAKAKALGLVSYTTQGEDEPKAWSAGPNLAAWFAARNAPAPAPTSAAQRKQQPNSRRGGRRDLLPPLDLSTLKVERGVPVAPRRIGARGDSKWAPVVALLKEPGDSLPLPMHYRGALYAYIKKAVKAGRLSGTYVVRACMREIGKCRVSRTA